MSKREIGRKRFLKWMRKFDDGRTMLGFCSFTKAEMFFRELYDLAEKYSKTESWLERFFLGIIWMDIGINFEVNYSILDGKYRIDFAFIKSPTKRLALELDGWHFHKEREQFNKDRLKTQDLIKLGWKVVRYSYDQIVRYSREELLKEIRRIYNEL